MIPKAPQSWVHLSEKKMFLQNVHPESSSVLCKVGDQIHLSAVPEGAEAQQIPSFHTKLGTCALFL